MPRHNESNCGPDLKYEVEYDYHTENDCENSGCNREGICRCGHIVDAHVEEPIKLDSLRAYLAEHHFGISHPSLLYLLDRLLRHVNAWDSDKYKVEVCGGYYGEEIDSIHFDSDTWRELKTGVEYIDSHDLDKGVELVLNLEYGEILPRLQNKTWEVEQVSLAQVHCGAEVHLEAITDNPYIREEIYRIPIGILTPESDGVHYRLWDGCHRFKAALARFTHPYTFLVAR